jgi:hypothetical protein
MNQKGTMEVELIDRVLDECKKGGDPAKAQAIATLLLAANVGRIADRLDAIQISLDPLIFRNGGPL